MKKIFTKKLNKKLLLTGIVTVMLAILIGIFALVNIHAIYKPCKITSLTTANHAANYISGVDKSIGYFTFKGTPALNCKNTTNPNEENFGPTGTYLETKSCQNDDTGKSYVVDSYEKCPFGCYAGSCMDKCQDPNKDNIFFKGTAFGFDSKTITNVIPPSYTPSKFEDYCTDSLNESNIILSKFLAKRVCDENNLVNSKVIECDSTCYNGACQKDTFRYCGDSDGSDRGKMQGTVAYYDASAKEPKEAIDQCLSNKTVTEYFCGTDKLAHRYVLTCRNSCSNGQCLQ
jgi:hypothetical protein